MINSQDRLTTMLYQYLLHNYDKLHEEYSEILRQHGKEVNSRKADKEINNYDLLSLIEMKAKVEMLDKIHFELWEILKIFDKEENSKIDK